MRIKIQKKKEDLDIVDEALLFFRANVLFQQFDIQGPADIVIVYLTAWIADCLRLLEKEKNRDEAKKKSACNWCK